MKLSPGEALYHALTAARAAAVDQKISRERWIQIANEVIDRERPAPKPRKKNILGAGLSDEQWLEQLAQDADFRGIDLVDQARRCRLYFKGKLSPSRARLLRWFAKAEPTNGHHINLTVGGKAPIPEPEDWRSRFGDARGRDHRYLLQDSAFYVTNWATATVATKTEICRAIGERMPT